MTLKENTWVHFIILRHHDFATLVQSLSLPKESRLSYNVIQFSLLYFKQIVLVAGGNGELDRYDLLLSSTELYSPSSDSWTAGQNLPW